MTETATNGVAAEKIEPEPSPVKIPPPQYSNGSPAIGSSQNGKDEVAGAASDSEDDVPLSKRLKENVNTAESSDDDKPLISRVKSVKSKPRRSYKEESASDDEDDYKPVPKKSKSTSKTKSPKDVKPAVKKTTSKKGDVKPSQSPKKAKEDEAPKWRWWDEPKRTDGTKWTFLQHNGPLFAPKYEPLPQNVHFKYNGERMKLSGPTEEVGGFYARMIDHEYTQKEIFNRNFFHDWRKVMTPEERGKITDLTKCDFREIDAYYKKKSQERKEFTKEQKLAAKEERAKEQERYGVAKVDGHEQKIANFRIEPPGLFRGRGDHPKMGKLKRRLRPEDVILNCSKDSIVPKPPSGHRWKEIRHDNSVTWMASWTENVQGQNKYVMFNPASKIKGEKDLDKFDMARRLHGEIDNIRGRYQEDFKSKEMMIRQRAVALYFIDKLALRAGNEKDGDEAADTVGCCSLRVEHIKLHEKKDDKEYVVEFDFPGKDSIRYWNEVPVDKKVFKNLIRFIENKEGNDDLFDRLDTSKLNNHLQNEMKGLTAKVFRTYNASITLSRQLEKLTPKNGTVHEKVLAYNRANREVAVLCNHQRAAPKTFDASMEKMKLKEKEIKTSLKELKADLDKSRGNEREKINKKIKAKKEQLARHRMQITDKDENKTIALGTSKLNYLDPRISVAWCLANEVPKEKIYSKTHREKFSWAIDMTDEDWRFDDPDSIIKR